MTDVHNEERDRVLRDLWICIRDELALLQDRARDEAEGQVVNPISGSTYSQNTGCAALVFVTDYLLSGEAKWLVRARSALKSLANSDVHSGVAEPKWNRLGWHSTRGSLFATGTLLDAVWRTLIALRLQDDEQCLEALLRYVRTCRINAGLYSHDSLTPGRKPIAIQNTTAIALYLMEVVAQHPGLSDASLRTERKLTLQALLKSQSSEGLWPYVYPTASQRLALCSPVIRRFAFRLPVVRRYLLGEGDRSILFGDTVHHCLVLYYLLKALSLAGDASDSWRVAVSKGWSWIAKHLVKTEGGGLQIDFDWEPSPGGFRSANFRDTSSYFLVLAMLPFLHGFRIISPSDYRTISTGILLHVRANLLQDRGKPSPHYPTSIKPYEGPEEILRFILPRVGEASAWKGALLAEYILSEQGLNQLNGVTGRKEQRASIG